MKEISQASIRRAAMDLLARREHSQLELSQKLQKRFSGQSEAIAEEINRLASEGLQSDARLAEAFIRARFNKGHGPVKIRAELKGKGVHSDLIAIAFEASEIDWFQLAERVAHRKFGDLSEVVTDRKEKARVARFLQQRGFSFDHISSLY